MAPRGFTLDEKYTRLEGEVTLTGVQALLRLALDQHRRDRAAGIRLGTYITGYQGSPLGEVEQQVRRAGKVLADHHVFFQPGINEDVAATAIYGTQLLERFPHERYDGVLGMWYGKGPGVDRAGDAFRHGNFVGTSTHGAALVLSGDDPACKSSTLPTDTSVALYDLNFPTFVPADPAEVLELGLHAVALSRYCGLWAALKIVTNVADGGATVAVHPELARPVLPALEIDGRSFVKRQMPHLLPPGTIEGEARLHYERLAAARAYVRANGLDRVTVRGPADRLGLVAAGKTYHDLTLALALLGLDEAELRRLGVRLYKPAVTAPVEPEGLAEFADGLREIVVVEEKRGFTEVLIRDALYNRAGHPTVTGKRDEAGRPLFPVEGEMQPHQIARILAPRLARLLERPELAERARPLAEIAARRYGEVMPRTPYFCSGCPHNTSTRLPAGELAGGGIGCHALAYNMDRNVVWLTQMGGEGAPWMGVAPFTERPHLFQNVGDGTYFHSASKAVEACIAAGVNMTFKVLFNAASAMTGGQVPVGQRSAVDLARTLVAQGAREVVVVGEDPGRYPRNPGRFIRIAHRDDYNEVMEALRAVKGVTVIVFDQQCAAEKRRSRKRGLLATPRTRVVINEAVCEGCGDCAVKSNCLSVIPLETDYGRKTRIHQSSCNLDYSCLAGDCPAFMTVEAPPGTEPRARPGAAAAPPPLPPEPAPAPGDAPWRMVLVGIGGTGVVTADALLVAAAHIEGRYALHLDQTGLAQKGGAVVSNCIVGDRPLARPARIAAGEADLVLAFDLLAAVAPDNLDRCEPGRTVAVANTHRTDTARVVTDIHARYPAVADLRTRLEAYTRPEANRYVDVEQLTEALFGDHLTNNIFLLGVASQAGLLPVRAASVEAAIEANGVAVAQNVAAFRWGRAYQADPAAVRAAALGDAPAPEPRAEALARLRTFAPRRVAAFERLTAALPGGEALAAVLTPRVADLLLYQDERYTADYLARVEAVVAAERARTPGRRDLGEAYARWLFKLMAYKDEYEVARLWVQHPTRAEAAAAYAGPVRRRVHLHPPLLRALRLRRKLRLGGWVIPLLALLARLRFLRGTPWDPFGRSAVRREERRLVSWYTGLVEGLLPHLTHENHATAVALAALPDGIRGYEGVKLRTIAETEAEAVRLLAAFHQGPGARAAG